MPIDYSKYPKNWKTEIRPRILKRAENKCEFCKIDNYAVTYYDEHGKRQLDYSEELCDEFKRKRTYTSSMKYKKMMEKECPELRFAVVVLTIAHLDHDISNSDDQNLRALCQKCHLGYDAKHHAMNAAVTRAKRRKQNYLFDPNKIYPKDFESEFIIKNLNVTEGMARHCYKFYLTGSMAFYENLSNVKKALVRRGLVTANGVYLELTKKGLEVALLYKKYFYIVRRK